MPIATALSLECGLPIAFIRKQAKTYGTCRAVEGWNVRDCKIVLVEDIITTGGAVLDAAGLIEAEGGIMIAVVCAIWRGEGGPHIAGSPGLPVFAALTKAELASRPG